MATLPGMQGEVFYGDVDRPLPDWRANLPEVDSDEPTQEEMDAAVSMLGFDPSEELRRMEEQEATEIPKQKTKKLVSHLPIVKSIKNRLVDKDKGQPCERGETAARSGCIPADGPGGQKPSQGQQSGGESDRQGKPEAITTSAPKPTGKTSGGSFEQIKLVLMSKSGNAGLHSKMIEPFDKEIEQEAIKGKPKPAFAAFIVGPKARVAKKRVAKAISSKMKESLGDAKIKEYLEKTLGADEIDKDASPYNANTYEELCAAILVGQWAKTSGDSDKISCRIQEAAMELFGLDEKSTYKHWGPELTQEAIPLEKEVYKAFIQATYDHTQETLKKAGIKELVLYRGLTLDKSVKLGKDVEMQTQPLSSFTYSYNIAKNFAEDGAYYRGKEPRIIAAKVPIDRVFSLWATGNGCMIEDEVVVIGGPGSCTLGEAQSDEELYWNASELK